MTYQSSSIIFLLASVQFIYCTPPEVAKGMSLQELDCSVIQCPQNILQAYQVDGDPLGNPSSYRVLQQQGYPLCDNGQDIGAYIGTFGSLQSCMFDNIYNNWIPYASTCASVNCATYPCTSDPQTLSNDIEAVVYRDGDCFWACAKAGCVGQPGQVYSVYYKCGDGKVFQGMEGCDDGNTEPGDGCDSFCNMEPNYTCEGSPSVCTPNNPPETECQDHNINLSEYEQLSNSDLGKTCTQLAAEGRCKGGETASTISRLCPYSCGTICLDAAGHCTKDLDAPLARASSELHQYIPTCSLGAWLCDHPVYGEAMTENCPCTCMQSSSARGDK